MANILYARMTLQHTPLLRRILVLLVVALVFNAHLLPGAAAGPLKYSHSSLVSALTGRPSSPAYGSLSGGGGGLNAVGASLGDAVDDVGDGSSGVDAAAAAALEGPGGSGGEVLVPKTFPMSPQEPTCEQLRAMWIFSKRQSRAAEMTNEIPTYRDPFAYNIWEPYYSTTRSMGALRVLPRYGERSRSPVFGRVISREPLLPQRVTVGHRQRHYGGDGGGSLSGSGSRIYGAESKAAYSMANGGGNARRPSQYRYVGANGSASNGAAAGNPNSVAVQGSFQKLKELIWTERAKELTQQRRAEELAARAAVLKEIANGQNIKSNYKPPFKSESSLMDENRSPDLESYQHDGRMSIATGQSYVSNNDNNKSYNANNNNNRNYNNNNNKNDRGSNNKNQNNNKNSGNNNSGGGGNKEVGMYTSTGSGMVGRAAAGGNSAAALAGSSTRSFGASNANSNIMNNNNNNYRGQQKSSFSGNFGFNSGRSGRLTLPGGYGSEEVGREREHNYGIPKSYPVRPSHFRERNRSLFKQRTPADLFERDIRNPETMRSFRRKQSPSIGQLIGTLNRRNRVPGAGSYTGGDDPYSTSLADMFSTEPRLLGSDNALSSAGLLGLVDGIEIDDNNIEAFLDYIDPVVSLMAYTGNNGNEQSGELYDYSSYY